MGSEGGEGGKEREGIKTLGLRRCQIWELINPII